MNGFAVGFAIGLAILAVYVVAIFAWEMRQWNGGKCRTCQAPLYFFGDTGSSRGYRCPACVKPRSVWIELPVDR